MVADVQALNISWLVPPVIQGSGGHRNIFRHAAYLSQFGHQNTIYCDDPTGHFQGDRELGNYVKKHYFDTGARLVRGRTLEPCDVLLATHWSTVEPVYEFPACSKKFYFVQDYEPLFYPAGVDCLGAERSHHLGLSCITLGRWLTHFLREKYGADCDYFDFAVDADTYRRRSDVVPRHRICFYAQPEKPRRCFELGIHALEVVHLADPTVEIVLFGSNQAPGFPVRFPHSSLGVITPFECAELYRSCKAGVVLSASNPSLIPVEMMACGCPVVELDLENNRFDYEPGVISLSSPNPAGVAQSTLRLLHHDEERSAQIDLALRMVSHRDSEQSARKLETLLLKGLTLGHVGLTESSQRSEDELRSREGFHRGRASSAIERGAVNVEQMLEDQSFLFSRLALRLSDLVEKDRVIEGLCSQLADTNRAVQAFNSKLAEKDQAAQRLLSQLAEKDRIAESLSHQLVEKRAEDQRLISQAKEKEAKAQQTEGLLSQIQNSRGWRTLQRYYRFRDNFLRAPRLAVERVRLHRDMRLITSSGLFDSAWYLQKYPDLARAGDNPLRHYLLHGAAEGRDPNHLFDSAWYLRKYPDVAQAGANPLRHYLRHGAGEGRDPSPLFDSDWYLHKYPDVARTGANPLAHYLRHGSAEGRATKAPVADAISVPIERKVVTRKSIGRHTQTVDIVVCVHNALDDTKRCLQSVIAHTLPPYQIIIVDDGSASETQRFLELFVTGQPARLVRNERGTGYTRAANRGLRDSTADYVVLLNSDTVVTDSWLDRLIACASSDSRIGIAGPLSNTASWQSVPAVFNAEGTDWADNQLPPGQDVGDYAREVARVSPATYPRVGFVNGFCFVIKRTLINDIGLFDEEAFGRGYGEENDYCLRAGLRGWQLAIADDAYVYHAQSKSYSEEKRMELGRAADETLLLKHGQVLIQQRLDITRNHPELEYMRRRCACLPEEQVSRNILNTRYQGMRLLFVLSAGNAGGGTNVILFEAAALREQGVDVWLANLECNRAMFEQYHPDLNVPVVYLQTPEALRGLAASYDAIIATLYLTVEWLKPLLAMRNCPVLGYYVQDFEPDFFPSYSSEYQRAWSSYLAIPSMKLFTKTQWNGKLVEEKVGVTPVVIGPSMDVSVFYPASEMSTNGKSVEIISMVRPCTPRRGPEFTMRILKRLQAEFGSSIAITIFGARPDDPALLAMDREFPHFCLGEITSAQVAEALRRADIFLDFSAFQAMGLTAMEAMASGTVVVGPENGGLREVIINEESGLLVDTRDEEMCYRAASRLIADKSLRQRLRKNALGVVAWSPIKSASRMMDALFPNEPKDVEG